MNQKDIDKLSKYIQIGNAFINEHYYNVMGHIDDLDTEEAVISDVFYGRATPCMDGTPAPIGLNIEVNFHGCLSAGVTFTNEDNIIKFMEAYGEKDTQNLIGRKILTYNSGMELMGIEPTI